MFPVIVVIMPSTMKKNELYFYLKVATAAEVVEMLGVRWGDFLGRKGGGVGVGGAEQYIHSTKLSLYTFSIRWAHFFKVIPFFQYFLRKMFYKCARLLLKIACANASSSNFHLNPIRAYAVFIFLLFFTFRRYLSRYSNVYQIL